VRIIGIDYGLARIGLAVSDGQGTLAFPLCTLRMRDFHDRDALLDELARNVAETGAEAVVMGLPLLEDGSETLTTRQVMNVTRRLKRRIPLPFYFTSELLTSEEAWSDLREAGVPLARRRAVLDQQAAVRLLQAFLDTPPDRWRAA
jgi:putative Holliday junction resolvase